MAITRSKYKQWKKTATMRHAYKLTPAHQNIARHNRFLLRLWKVPKSERSKNAVCVACLEPFKESSPSSGHMVIMSCDHAIHTGCFEKYARAYADNAGIPNYRADDDQVSDYAWASALNLRYLLSKFGAPCPACRLRSPMQHMAVFPGNPCANSIFRGPRN